MAHNQDLFTSGRSLVGIRSLVANRIGIPFDDIGLDMKTRVLHVAGIHDLNLTRSETLDEFKKPEE